MKHNENAWATLERILKATDIFFDRDIKKPEPEYPEKLRGIFKSAIIADFNEDVGNWNARYNLDNLFTWSTFESKIGPHHGYMVAIYRIEGGLPKLNVYGEN